VAESQVAQVGAGFQAMATGDWRGARDAFSAVLAVAEVPEALFGLANALFWLGDLAGTIASCEKAYAGFRRRGDPMFAAGAALSLVGYNKGYLGNTAAARGWLSRAARIIENEAPELRGELLGATAYVTEDPVESEALARQAAEIGRANGHSDLELMAMHAVGQALVQQGRTEEGMALLDEAMAGVIGGEYGDPLTAAQMSCMTMVVCGSCFDLERATQWVQSLQGFIERYGCPFLYAECRTYYGRVLFENGDWGAAETLLAEASRKCSPCSAKGCPIPRSPVGCSCRARRSSTTWRVSCPSSACADGPRPRRSPYGVLPDNQPQIGEFADAPPPGGPSSLAS
jgi:tetratricopeptide (TPR) repeat protein